MLTCQLKKVSPENAAVIRDLVRVCGLRIPGNISLRAAVKEIAPRYGVSPKYMLKTVLASEVGRQLWRDELAEYLRTAIPALLDPSLGALEHR